MKVKNLIEQLTAYSPDTELLVAYWDKECVEGYKDGLTLTDEQWEEVVDKYEDGEWSFQSSAAEDFVDLANEVLEETASPND
jgi:hypothetical protein